MILNDEEIELVRRFHESDLSEEELGQIASRIESDPEFKTEVEKLGLVRKAIVSLVAHNQGIRKKSNILKSRGEALGNKKNRYFTIAFLCLMVAIAGIIFLKPFGDNGNDKLFADCEAYTYSISSDIMRSTNVNANSILLNEEDEVLLRKVMNSYGNDDLEHAIEQALLLKNQTEDINSQEIVSWWLVTIYLKNNNIEDVQRILLDISEHPDFNSKLNAKEMLKNF